MSTERDSYFIRLGRRVDVEAVFGAYQSGDAKAVLVGLLPLVANTVWKTYPDLHCDIRNDIISEIALTFVTYIPEKLMDKEFDAAPKLMAYIHARIRGLARNYVGRSFPQIIEDCGETNPLLALIATPDADYEEQAARDFIRNFVRSNIRLSGIRRRHALAVISEGRSALRGVTTPKVARFISDYLAVQARIAGREYDGV